MRSYSPWPPPAWSWSSWLWQRSAKCLKTRRGSTAQERHRRSTAKIKRRWKTLKSTDHHHPRQAMGWMWQILSGEGGFGGRGGGWWPNRGKTDYREVTTRQNNRSTRLGGRRYSSSSSSLSSSKSFLYYHQGDTVPSEAVRQKFCQLAVPVRERWVIIHGSSYISSHQSHPMATKIILWPSKSSYSHQNHPI